MTHDIFEDAARALVGFDGKPEAAWSPSGLTTRLAQGVKETEDTASSLAAMLRDAFVRGLALAACSHAAIPLEVLNEAKDRR